MLRSDPGESLSLEGVRVLVADDEEGIRYVVTRMLEKRGMIADIGGKKGLLSADTA